MSKYQLTEQAIAILIACRDAGVTCPCGDLIEWDDLIERFEREAAFISGELIHQRIKSAGFDSISAFDAASMHM